MGPINFGYCDEDGNLDEPAVAVDIACSETEMKKSEEGDAMIDKQTYQPLVNDKNYADSMGIYKTDKYIMRVDSMRKGDDEFGRFALWKIGKPLLEKPNIVINNCEREQGEGSAGGRAYVCRNGKYLVILSADYHEPFELLVIYKVDKKYKYIPYEYLDSEVEPEEKYARQKKYVKFLSQKVVEELVYTDIAKLLKI